MDCSLVGYSPQGRKESDTTERLHFHFTFLSHAYLLKKKKKGGKEKKEVGEHFS